MAKIEEVAGSGRLQVYKDKAGQLRWRARSAGNNKVVADSGESYKTLRALADGVAAASLVLGSAAAAFTSRVEANAIAEDEKAEKRAARAAKIVNAAKLAKK